MATRTMEKAIGEQRRCQNRCVDETMATSKPPSLDKDRLNFCLLILLYIIQGFPIGLCIAFPLILQNRKSTYEDQANFSVTQWPYSFKLLWAPVVDALYVQWIGRRKCWLVPLQFSMGLLLLYLANNIDIWLPAESSTQRVNLTMLISVMFAINCLSATQDIVVDGWALTMFKKKNVGYASTCNSVGVPVGMFIGSICFTLLVSKSFSDKYLWTRPGTGELVTMKNFLYSSGIIVLLITVLVGILKKEKDNRLEDSHVKINVIQTYTLLWNILKLPSVRVLAIALLTTKFGFAATDFASNLKLIDAGISKDEIMILTSAMYLIKVLLPIFVSKYVTGPKPMSYYLKMTPYRLFWAIFYVALIYYTPSLIIHTNKNVIVPTYYYLILGFVCTVNEIMSFFMMLTLFAFFCHLSDPQFGGTYMTLFNTFYYVGFALSNTLILKLVAVLTFCECSNNAQNTCSTADLKKICKSTGGSCETLVDGYCMATIVCFIAGFIWFYVFKNFLENYQTQDRSYWLVNVKRSACTEKVKELSILSSS